ncbi:unnamed protein product [Dovyalis caffra]|uniref:Uncharacterized protein n=1 Tax=Dovyalis caffra TaxID=77055 RepID=A0AAV1RWZ5_9ROSI|nr:unnamed protein product [Dovyalis caffra]
MACTNLERATRSAELPREEMEKIWNYFCAHYAACPTSAGYIYIEGFIKRRSG